MNSITARGGAVLVLAFCGFLLPSCFTSVGKWTREKLGGLAAALGGAAPPLPDDLLEDLAISPPRMPPALGVDLPPPAP